MTYTPLKFSREANDDFIKTLRARVKDYFSQRQISQHANTRMVVKTITLVLMYLVPYGLMITGVITNAWLNFGLWVVMGIAIAGIGMSVMHDANHGSYSSNKHVNRWVGYVLNLVGGFCATWKIQHNRLHHSFTNIEGHDEDIDPGPLMRLSPHAKRYKYHRFQYIYGWFLYGLMTLIWITTKDFQQLKRYKDSGLLGKRKNHYPRLLAKLIAIKVFYYIFLLVIPIIVLPTPWYITAISFVSMHFIAGLILACVFQLAHVMPDLEYPLPDDTGTVENNWAIHQLCTTTNFAPNNKLLSWYVGGLNYQVEHHIFPNICHVHYKHISKIVKETAAEFELPYFSVETFSEAIGNHVKMLKILGKEDVLEGKVVLAPH